MNYCKLYVHSDADEDVMDSIFDAGVDLFLTPYAIVGLIFRNESYIFDANPEADTYALDRSRYYAELGVDPDADVSEEKFKSCVSNLIVWLRARTECVIASCEFEDYVIQTTGWNWTPEQPLPPPKSLQ